MIKTQVAPRLKVKTLPKNLLRAQQAGEIAFNAGASESTVEIAQRGFASEAWQAMLVYGVDGAGKARELAVFAVHEAAGGGTIEIEDDDGRSIVERLDAGLAEGVRRYVARLQRLGLTVEIRFRFAEAIQNDPARRAKLLAELGCSDRPALETAAGYELTQVARLKPGRDQGQTTSFFWGKRRR